MGLTTFFRLSWVIEDIVNHVGVVLHIFQEAELKVWRLGLEHGLKITLMSLNCWHMPDLRQAAFK